MVKENQLEGVMSLINGKIEEVKLPVDKARSLLLLCSCPSRFEFEAHASCRFYVQVDVIISEVSVHAAPSSQTASLTARIAPLMPEPNLNVAVPCLLCLLPQWMGTFLVCESMIESALIARDKYLKPGGIM